MAHDVTIAGVIYKGVSIVTLTDSTGIKHRYIEEDEAGDGFFTLDMDGDLILKNETTWSPCFGLDKNENIILLDNPETSKYFGPDKVGDVTLVSDDST